MGLVIFVTVNFQMAGLFDCY